jgi:hypothetical protein
MKIRNTHFEPSRSRITSTGAGLLKVNRAAVLALVFAGATLLSTSGTSADTIIVINTNDSGPGSLRGALAIANDGDTIDATGVSGTIFLTSGVLEVNHNVTINGPGAGSLAIDSNHGSRVFDNFASNVTISGFTITNGGAFCDPCGAGCGILNQGGLTVNDCIVSHSSSYYLNPGGGILSWGTLTVTKSTVYANDGWSGGIFSSGGTLTVSDCIISSNHGVGINNNGGALVSNCVINGNHSGGIYNFNGVLTVTNSTISGNSGPGIDSGSHNGGAAATVTNCTISGNSGGGITSGGFDGGATLTISNSTISGNSALLGGGIFSGADGGNSGSSMVTISNSTISGNSAASDGGGIYNSAGNRSFAGLSVNNSTISDNSAASGGGIKNYSQNSRTMLEISTSTFSGNTASVGSSIYNDYSCCGSATVSLQNTILNAGAAGENIFNNSGTVTSLGYNLSSDNGSGYLIATGDQININPMLGPLQDNGGATFTHALLLGSPAINAGDPSFNPPPLYDQRGPGFDRVDNGRIDIGSFEVQTDPTPTPTPTPKPSPRPWPTQRPHPTPVPRR